VKFLFAPCKLAKRFISTRSRNPWVYKMNWLR